MGSPNSKMENKKDFQTSEAHLVSTPISTPKQKVIDCDPRSPSANIVRTPIIHDASKINKLDTPIIGVLNALKLEDQVHIDPRSPSVEFTRTPIVLPNGKQNKLTYQPVKLRNKNLDLVRQQLTNFSPMRPHGTNMETVKNKINKTEIKLNQGPILLAASPFTKKVIEKEKRRSFVGLLETDLDFVETDLDFIIRNGKTEKGEGVIIEAEEVIIEEEEVIIEGEEVIIEEEEEVEEKKELIEEPEDLEMSVEEKLRLNKEAFVSPIKEALEKMSQIDQEIKDVIASVQTSLSPIEIEGESLSTAFDKKVSNLIYEDQPVITPKTLKSVSNVDNPVTANRTPLGERNMNHNTSHKKSSNKLKVRDQPSNLNKKDYTVSKIPVFKEKKGKKNLLQQCENTPPRQKLTEQQKIRKTQWDGDNTLII